MRFNPMRAAILTLTLVMSTAAWSAIASADNVRDGDGYARPFLRERLMRREARLDRREARIERRLARLHQRLGVMHQRLHSRLAWRGAARGRWFEQRLEGRGQRLEIRLDRMHGRERMLERRARLHEWDGDRDI